MKLDDISKRLTVNERFMVHILAYQAYIDSWEVPYQITQKGLAEGIGINRGEVPRAAKALKEMDLIFDERKHIIDETRKKVVYFLSRKGLQEAVKIRNHLMKMGYEPEILEVQVKPESVPKKKVALPAVDYFFGRDEELLELTKVNKGKRKPLVFIYGMAGIGKTTLVMNFLSTLDKDKKVVWHRCQGFDTLDYVVKNIGKQLGFSKLDGNVNIILRDIINHIFETDSVFFMDDIHKLKPEILTVIELIKERLYGTDLEKNPLFIFTSRDQLRLYDVRDLKIRSTVQEINLTELDKKSSMEFIDFLLVKNRPKATRLNKDELYEITKGYPLAIELLQMGRGSRFGAFDEFIREEIMPSLVKGQERMLTYLSCYREPFNIEALMAPDQEIFDISDFDDLVYKRIIKKDLIEIGEEILEFFSLHDSIGQFFFRRILPKDMEEFNKWCCSYYKHIIDQTNMEEDLDPEDVHNLKELFYFILNCKEYVQGLEVVEQYYHRLKQSNYHEDALVMISDLLAEIRTEKVTVLSPKQVHHLKLKKEQIMDVWGGWDIFLEHMVFGRFLSVFLEKWVEKEIDVKNDFQLKAKDDLQYDTVSEQDLRDTIKDLEAIGDHDGLIDIYKDLGWRGLFSMVDDDPLKDLEKGIELAKKHRPEALGDLNILKAEVLFQAGEREDVSKIVKMSLKDLKDYRRVFFHTLSGALALDDGKNKEAMDSFIYAKKDAQSFLHLKGIQYSELHSICTQLLLGESSLDGEEIIERITEVYGSFRHFQDEYGMFFSELVLAIASSRLGNIDKGKQHIESAIKMYAGLDIRSESLASALETLKYHINGLKSS
jgi:type II secretory pathway predicted ATPase ExeA